VAATEDAKFAEVKGCRYCEKSQELVNDSLGVAYPVCCTSIGPLTPTQCVKKMLYIYLEEKGESIIVVGVLERTFIWAGSRRLGRANYISVFPSGIGWFRFFPCIHQVED
jgi:hypothetical protein